MAKKTRDEQHADILRMINDMRSSLDQVEKELSTVPPDKVVCGTMHVDFFTVPLDSDGKIDVRKTRIEG